MTATTLTSNTVLLLIDIQKGLDDWSYYGGNRNNLDAELKAAHLLGIWRKKSWPIIHVKHSSTHLESPLHPSNPGHAIKVEVAPLANEPVIAKNVNSAFIGTDLEARLRAAGQLQLVIVGLTTNHCISTSVRMGANLGFEVLLVADATATFDRKNHLGVSYDAETVHQTTLASLHNEFATVITTDQLLLLADAVSE